jgi:SAM-dependent methyltransferase
MPDDLPFIYGADANPDLLSRIPRDARCILDVGCGAGALGAAFRRINPRCRLIGIEPDPALAARAARHFDALHGIDIETTPPPIAPGTLDAMVFGDVLEHLRDPWAVLRRDASLLAPEGVLLICIPNIEHWSFAARLLAGGWRYEDHGLYDRTHLRWFTPAMMQQALLEAGLTPIEVAPRIFAPEHAERFAAALAPALRTLGISEAGWLNRSKPLQYVWRATRTPPQPLIVAARTLQDSVTAMAEVRVLQPLREIATAPGIGSIAAADLVAVPGGPEVPRIMILQRLFLRPGTESFGLIGALRGSGAVIVQEFDDDPARWPEIEAAGHMTFRAVHAVQTSTPALASLLRQWHPEVEPFPFGVETLPVPQNFRRPGQLSIFFGAINREADIAPFLPVLDQALAEAAGRLSIEIVHDRTSFDALATPHKRFTPSCDYALYQRVMAGCELAFLPLAESRFNSMKSDIKAVEAASHGLCCLASPTVYGATLRDGETGVLLGDPAALLAALRGLLANPDAARRIGAAAHRWVAEERMGAYQMRRRIDWYRSLCARRDALDEALGRRLAALAPEAEAA